MIGDERLKDEMIGSRELDEKRRGENKERKGKKRKEEIREKEKKNRKKMKKNEICRVFIDCDYLIFVFFFSVDFHLVSIQSNQFISLFKYFFSILSHSPPPFSPPSHTIHTFLPSPSLHFPSFPHPTLIKSSPTLLPWQKKKKKRKKA